MKLRSLGAAESSWTSQLAPDSIFLGCEKTEIGWVGNGRPWIGLRPRTFYLFAFMLLLVFSLASGLESVYAAAPTSTTLSPTGITATSATLRGSVNPNGVSTIVDFASALPSGNPGYFSPRPSPPQNIGSGIVPVLVSYTLTGLTPATEYRYAVRASNADGNQNGVVVTFHTLPAVVSTDWAVVSVGIQPSSPTAGTAVQLGMTVIALSTTGGYPQSFAAQCIIDGSSCGSGALTYPGPTGVTFTVTAGTPWIATPGTHTLSWQVDTTNDPNPGNNFGSTTFTVAAPTPFDFDITTSPGSLTSQPGQTQTASVNVNLKSGTPNAVTLTVSGQPGGVTASLNPTSGTPTYTSTLTVAVSNTATAGTYSFTVTGSGGGQTHSSTIMLTISNAADFRIEVNPASQSVAQGQTTSYSVSVVGSNGFNSQVSLSVSGLPPGANGVFSIPSGTPDFTATMTITLPTDVQTGSFTLMIKGSGGGLDKTANAVLIIGAVTTQTQAQTTTQTSGAGLLETLQQGNTPLYIGLLAVIVLLAALTLRRRKAASPPPPPKPCPTCGQPLTYVKQYDKWYCNNCKAYK